MLRFGPGDSGKPRRIVPARGRLWHLLVMLAITLGLVIGSWYQANRLRTQEGPVKDKSGTATVTAAIDGPEQEGVEGERGGGGEGETTSPLTTHHSPLTTHQMVQAVELSRLSDFQDHSRNIEADPYYYLLDLARRNPARWMEEHARRDVTYAHLLDSSKADPDKYRGQLIFLKGRLRQLKKLDLHDNEYGISVAYEGSLFTDEGGRNPYVVVVTEPPAGMPLGPIFEYVSSVAYYLGWWRYTDAQGKAYSAPILIGRRFVWHQVPPLRPDLGWAHTYGLTIGIAVLVACLVAAYFGLRRRPPGTVPTSGQDFETMIFDKMPTDETGPRIEDRG